jgi:D-glycero-D-manno-heptose 1,7-bisphosphate phosphatase
MGVLRHLDMDASFNDVRYDERKQHVVYNENMFPAVFLDRDGVLIENRANYVREWSQVSVYPKTYSSLISIQDAGYKIVVVTNQSAVGRGLITVETANEINERLVDLIRENGGQVDGVYLCPHRPEDDCECRKPKPGLLLQAAQELSLDFSRSWMVGDAWSDMLAGQAVGLRGTILVRTGRGREQFLQPQPENLKSFFAAHDLADAARIIVADGSH